MDKNLLERKPKSKNAKKNSALFLTGVAVTALGFGILNVSAAQAPRLMTPAVSTETQISFADLVEKVSPAVVSVHTETQVQASRRSNPLEEFGFRLPEEMRERFGRNQEEDGEATRRAAAEGSGFFIDKKGHVVTNNHVIENADTITIKLNDGQELAAELVGRDKETDLAVLKVKPPKNQPFVDFADDVDLRVGDWVLAVGNPFGLGGTVTSGIVSALGRDNYSAGSYNDFIQIDAPINRGNSGGPTFDLRGRVVGVNTAIFSPTGGSVGIGFAIPADVAQFITSQLINKGAVTRGWLGVEIRDMDTTMAAALELANTDGAFVANVNRGSPAAKAGFKEGDVVLAFNGRPIDGAVGLTRSVGSIEPGKTVVADVWRDGKKQKLKVKLETRTDEVLRGEITEDDELSKSSSETSELGITYSSLDDEARASLRLDDDVEGVLITDVKRNSPAAEAGIQRGMVIIKAGGDTVKTPKDLEKKIKEAKSNKKEALLLRVQTGQRRDFRALPLEDVG